MKRIERQDIEKYSKQSLFSLAVDLSENLDVASAHIKNLEKQLERLTEELGAKNQKVLFAAETLNRAQNRLFGRSSEVRKDDNAASIFADQSIADEAERASSPKPSKPRKKRTVFGRTPQPNLPVQEVHHYIAKEETQKFGLIEWEGQYETSEMISFVPSRVILQKHCRHKYFKEDPASGKKTIITAPGPIKLKDGSRYSPEFGVEVGLNKYLLHQPLERQVKMFDSYGLKVTSQTLFEQIDTIAWYLKPVFRKITDEIRRHPVNQADDTTWMNLEDLDTREQKKFYLWAVLNEKAACFNIYNARNQKTARNFLGNLKGYLITDGHSSFRALASNELILANDWCHARRKFIEAEKNYPSESKRFLHEIRKLFKIEEELKDKPPNEKHLGRQELSKPVIETIRHLLDTTPALPQSALGRAIAYTDKLWEGLVAFLSDPRIPIHTNDVERALRGPAIGRKNHFGSKNLETAKVAAIWYSIITTCKLNGIDVRDYICSTLNAILSKQPYLTPWEWAANTSSSQ